MPNPTFSILIPTRDRPETLAHTLATVVSQPGTDYEVVIADNASRPEVQAIANSVTNCALIYTRSDAVIPMTDNWLRGLEACSGEFITVLGDDDGLMPSALPMARHYLRTGKPDILTWTPHQYYWPDFIVETMRNFIFVSIPQQQQVIPLSSQTILHGFFNGVLALGRLPMLYNSFVHRSFLQRTQATWGSMIPLPHCPDVYSGLFNLILTESVLYSSRPLSIRGSCGKSFGTANLHPKRGKTVLDKGMQEEGFDKPAGSKSRLGLHPDLRTLEGLETENFHASMASLKLRFRDLALPGHRQLRINIPQLIEQILATTNRDPSSYQETLAYAQGLAKKYGFSVNPASIPPLSPNGDEIATPTPGVYSNGQDGIQIIARGSSLPVSDIDQACRFGESFFPDFA